MGTKYKKELLDIVKKMDDDLAEIEDNKAKILKAKQAILALINQEEQIPLLETPVKELPSTVAGVIKISTAVKNLFLANPNTPFKAGYIRDYLVELHKAGKIQSESKSMLAATYTGFRPLLKGKIIEKVYLGDNEPYFQVTESYKNKNGIATDNAA